ncbi:MAG TPA: hypothetical protein VIH76_18745 [Candidatus Acidoferrales bacterium]
MPKFNPGLFVNRTDANGVLLLTILTTPQEALIPLARLGIDHLVNGNRAAMDASGSLTPPLTLYEFDGGQFVRASQWDFLDNI